MYTKQDADLIQEFDVRKHIDHHADVDPNRVIHEEYLRLDPAKARRFLEYRGDFERVKATRQALDRPLTVNMALNNSCNLHCPTCFREYPFAKHEKNILRKEEIFSILDQCAAMGTPALLLGAGSELFLHKDALAVIDRATELGFLDIFIATNGILMTREIIDRILESGVTRLCVSLDAATAETYAKVRGGDFQKAVGNLERFLERRAELGKRLPILRVSFVRSNLNRHEEGAFIGRWRGKADIVDIQALIGVESLGALRDLEADEINCAYPWNMLYVSWDGTYKPCCAGGFNEYLTLGNIREQSLSEIWNSPELAQHRADMLNKERFPKVCVNCVKSINADETFAPLK